MPTDLRNEVFKQIWENNINLFGKLKKINTFKKNIDHFIIFTSVFTIYYYIIIKGPFINVRPSSSTVIVETS